MKSDVQFRFSYIHSYFSTELRTDDAWRLFLSNGHLFFDQINWTAESIKISKLMSSLLLDMKMGHNSGGKWLIYEDNKIIYKLSCKITSLWGHHWEGRRWGPNLWPQKYKIASIHYPESYNDMNKKWSFR